METAISGSVSLSHSRFSQRAWISFFRACLLNLVLVIHLGGAKMVLQRGGEEIGSVHPPASFTWSRLSTNTAQLDQAQISAGGVVNEGAVGKQGGGGGSHDRQFSRCFSGGMGERLVSFSPLRKVSPSSPLTSTHFQSQIAKAHVKCMKFQAVTETVQHSQTSVEESSAGKLNVVLEAAKTEEKLRAAATLRARSFYSYPEGRSRDALAMHQKMKAEDEWTTLTRKVGGMEPGYKRTTCVIALCPISDMLDMSTDLLQSYCKISQSPAEDWVVVGTLDINQGLLLPGELTGDHPQGPDAEHCRAYLSNVCVAKEVRRQGVGMLLMQHVKKTAKLWGVSDLYVHVVVDNISARKLYEKAGFVYEKEEAVKDARSMCRPRRYLLRAQL